MFDKIDYKTIHILGREVRVSINHHERSISARLGEHHPAELRVTGYLAERLALGASVRVERGADEDLHVGLYLGPLRLYAGINNRLLRSLVETARLGRRVTSLEVSLADRYGEPENGAAINLRGHLWDDDNTSNAASRAISVDLLDSLLGKVVTSDKQVVDEREVVVPLPEGSFTTKARLVERFDSRPGWPFKRYHRWVEFRETPAPVPLKGGGMSFYNMGGPWTGITGRSFEEGVAELVRRVLEQRARYGSKAWATGVPSGGEHDVSVWRVVDGKEQEVWRGALGHGERQIVGAPVSPSLRVAIEPDGSFPDAGPPVVLKREPRHGGVVLDCGAILLLGHVLRGGDRLPRVGDIPLVMQDEIHVRGEVFKVYGSPIGPAPASAPTQSGNVNAFNILAAAKAAGLHGVNAGPTLGHRVGRQALQGLPAAHALLAEQLDPQWFAANAEIVDGARKVHDASTFDVETRSWIEPSQAAQAAILRSEREAYERGLQWQANQAEQADVQEVLAQLDTTPPGPTEEADGLAARERLTLGDARRYVGVDLSAGNGDQTSVRVYEVRDGVPTPIGGAAALDVLAQTYMGEVSQRYTAASALSEVLGDGTADLPPAPVDTRPWLPAGDLVVTVARGELKTTVRLPRAASYRIGAHKDAEVRLLGVHMIAATLLQQDGAVWICRGADNVAVDLLGLDIRETVRLREGVEVQIGQLYTLTIASAAKPAV
jgi:hypothetical protein